MARPERTLSVFAVVTHNCCAKFCRRVDFKAKQLFSKPGQFCTVVLLLFCPFPREIGKCGRFDPQKAAAIDAVMEVPSFLLAFLKVFLGFSGMGSSCIFWDCNRNIPLKYSPLHPASQLTWPVAGAQCFPHCGLQ